MCSDEYDSTVQMCVEISRQEYEYSFKRAEKFNNKVYILLTVCGFITKLVSSLSGLVLKHYDSNLILEFNMMSKSAVSVARFAVMQYEKARDYNNRQIDKRYKSLDKSVKGLIVLAAVLIFITIVGNFAVSQQVK